MGTLKEQVKAGDDTASDKVKGAVKELLELKAQYKKVTGIDFPSAAPQKKEKKKQPQEQQAKKPGLNKKELNKLTKKAKKNGLTLEEYAKREGIDLTGGADAAQ